MQPTLDQIAHMLEVSPRMPARHIGPVPKDGAPEITHVVLIDDASALALANQLRTVAARFKFLEDEFQRQGFEVK